jgi:glycosyltransferase involved in cell wall biosynthesis
MRWVVASPYFETPADRWIGDSVRSEQHSFVLIPRIGQERNWHQAGPPRATVREWSQRVRQAQMAVSADADGMITVFPQLAAAVGSIKAVRRVDRPLVSWFFNTEGLTSLPKRTAAHLALSRVDRFVVHSTREMESYADLLDLPSERFIYVPFQYGAKVETDFPEGQDEPYVFATGSGYRDYETFFAAMDALGHRTLVLASDRVLAGLTVPPNVEILEQITRPEIRRLVRHARVNVVPLNDGATTAGIVTIVETFRHGRSLVITDRPGIDDYIIDGKNALCTRLYDSRSMADAIEAMWSDDRMRGELDEAAFRFAEDNCTDEAAARSLVRILDSVANAT